MTVFNNVSTTYRNYYQQDNYRYYYSQYFAHGFYGGYYYPVRPCFDIQNYFDYPAVQWLYAQDYDAGYYGQWYGDSVNQYPVQVFQFADAFYPTDTLRDLGIEISALDAGPQYQFRQDMDLLGQELTQAIAYDTNSDFVLTQYAVVVDHYENLNNQAIALAGFVDKDNIHVVFKALLDLNDASQTLVFVPSSDNPTQQDLDALGALNDRIVQLGGHPDVADAEPQQ